jgi:hypothetical protein
MSDTSFESVVNCSLSFLQTRNKKYYNFWLSESIEPLNNDELISACDVIYSLCLLNYPVEVSNQSIENFFQIVNNASLYGTKIDKDESYNFNAHLTAYILGTIQLLRDKYPDETKALNTSHEWDFNSVLDDNCIPKFPAKFTHHSWRVSHWLGGVPSIILNVFRETGEKKYNLLFEKIIASLEKNAITDKGLIKVHKSGLLHSIFRNLYRMRHDPKIGDIGGIVHILWLYHFTGKKYKAVDNLVFYSLELAKKQEKFMETIPYCLDFDFIQLIRTGLEQQGNTQDEVLFFERFKKDLISYFTKEMLNDENFTLHKLPGALATLHECELYLNRESNLNNVDIIKIAGWL